MSFVLSCRLVCVSLAARERRQGAVLVDGWKDCEGKHLLNTVHVQNDLAAYVRSKDATGVARNADEMAQDMLELCELVGVENVLQVRFSCWALG